MLFLAFCGGVAMQTIRQFTQRLRVLIPCMLFFSVLPFMNVFSVYVLKDSFFSGVFLLFCCSLLQLLQDRGESVRKNIIAWIVFGILSFSICLLRSNGWYAFLVMTPFLIAGMKGQRKKLLLTILPVILLAGILRGPVMRAAGVIQPDIIESLCVPLQQVSRVRADKKEISKEQKELLSCVIDLDAVPSLYNAGFADNMKELVRAGHEEYLDEHKAQFFRLWLDLGRRYPGTYLCALADLTEGYWFPENNYETMIREFLRSGTKRKLVIITTPNQILYEELDRRLHFTEDSRVCFAGTVYDQDLLEEIRRGAHAYLHGHSVGGTNPSLLEALGATDLNLLYDVGFNREVAKDAALYWTLEEGSLSSLIDRADRMTETEIIPFGQRARKRIREAFSWPFIVSEYERLLLDGVMPAEGKAGSEGGSQEK